MGKKSNFPNFSEEKRLWRKGYKFVTGVDEVGRGAFAGPVVAGAVVFAPAPHRKVKMKNWEDEILDLGVNDSKVLRPRKREELVGQIKRLALAYVVTSSSVGEINRMGIGKATMCAFRRAIAKLLNGYIVRRRKGQFNNFTVNVFVLSDAFHIKYLRGIGLAHQKAIKKGDKKSLSIAAASILAKVYRDRLMKRLARKYPKYGWQKNKGYGTKEHRKAILRYGLTRWHRKAFVRKVLSIPCGKRIKLGRYFVALSVF